MSNSSKKIVQLFQDLHSENPAKVTSALDSLQVYGNPTIIKPLFEFVQQAKHETSRKEVIEFLSSLKDTPSKAEVMSCVKNKQLSSILIDILSTIWNSPLDYSEYLSDFVQLAVENDYLCALECLTIIENREGPFEEKSILEAQLHLKDYLESKKFSTKEKDAMMSEIALLIKDFDRENQEFD